MRTVSILDLNLGTADNANPEGIVHFGRFFDIGGDAETEAVIMNDGDESLSLNYNNIELLEPMYVGDMMQFRSYITNVGNTSRDFVIEGYKVATPAFRAGVKDAKPGDMVWFDEPVLCSEGDVRLVVKKHLQRGEQPDGAVKDPWGENPDFSSEVEEGAGEEVIFRYRMSDRDVFYGGGVVNGARSLTLMNDAANRLMAKVFQNTGHCVGVNKVRLYTPCFAGDYMEYRAKLMKKEGNKAVIQVRSFKIIEVPVNPPYPSSIDVLADPPLSTIVEYVYEAY